MGKIADTQRSIAFWDILVLLAIPIRNERKVPRAITGDVKVRVTNWHQVHSQLQICPCTNPVHMETQVAEQSDHVSFLVVLEGVSVLQPACFETHLIMEHLIGGHFIEVLGSECDV